MTTNQRSARLVAAGIFLALTFSSASASTITSFNSNCGSVPSPVASPGSNAFSVNLPASFLGVTCAIDFNYTSGPANTYNFAVAVTNNTGQVMTDLEIPLFSIPGDTFTSEQALGPDLPYDPGLSSSTYLVFMGPPNLALGATETFDFSILTPAANIGGFDSVQIIPTFTPNSSVPEPASLAFVSLGLASVAVLRRRLRGESLPGSCGERLDGE